MPAPLFSAKAHCRDPYRTFKLQIVMDGRIVAGFRKMSALKKTTDAVALPAEGDPPHMRKLPGATRYETITLEQGLTQDPMFTQWANAVNATGGDVAKSMSILQKDIVINLMNLQGEVAMTYLIKRAWVSEYQALPDFDAGGANSVAIRTIRLEHEGWDRVGAATEPPAT